VICDKEVLVPKCHRVKYAALACCPIACTGCTPALSLLEQLRLGVIWKKKKKKTKKVHFCFFSQRVIGVVLLRDFGMLHMR
jgi:hypothetical protein